MSARFFRHVAFVAVIFCIIFSSSISFGDQPIVPPYIHAAFFPHMSALELMHAAKEIMLKQEVKKFRKKGKEFPFGQIEITSDPEWADVYVSSYIPLGSTPFQKGDVPTGSQRVTIRKNGFFDHVAMVDINKDQLSKLHVKLAPIPYATLSLQLNQPNAKVTIIGNKEKYFSGIKLVPGDYTFKIDHPDYDEYKMSVDLKDSQTLSLDIDLKQPSGSIEVNSAQPGCTVYIDGEEAGTTPITSNNLLPGPHKLQVWKSLYKPTTMFVNIESGKKKSVSVDLEENEHFTNSLGMTFVKIPAGEFMMGYDVSPEEESLISGYGVNNNDKSSLNEVYSLYMDS